MAIILPIDTGAGSSQQENQTAGLPWILSDNRFSDGAPTATSTAAGASVLNLTDWRPYTYWQASDTALQRIVIDCGVQKSADTLCLLSHNLNAASASVQVIAYANNYPGDATQQTALLQPASDELFNVTFPLATARYWAIEITGAAVPAYVGIATLGTRTTFPEPVDGLYTPYTLKPKMSSNISGAGNLLGVDADFVQRDASFRMTYVPESWFRSTFLTLFNKHLAKGIPYFFCHNDEHAKDDVFLYRYNGTLAPTYQEVLDRKFTMKMTGIAE